MAHPPALPAAAHEGDARDGSGPMDGGSTSACDARGGSVAQFSADADAAALAAVRKPLVPHSVRSQYPLNVAVDFTQLRANALRRYMAYHRIQEVPGSSREQLAVAVARHFNEECQRADESASISSFVSYLTSAKEDQDADRSPHGGDDDMDKENTHPRHQQQRPVVVDDDSDDGAHDSDLDMDDDGDDDDGAQRDGAYDYYPNQQEEEDAHELDDDDDDDDDDRLEDAEYDHRAYTQRKRKPSSSEGSETKSTSHGKSSKSSSNNNSSSSNSKKKKRKARVYCVCKGSSHGNMIACDNKKCLDRSNWYHMGCIGLDPSKDAPETWYCPTCQEQDPSEIPENQYRKPVASVTYGDMISHALNVLPHGKGTFKEICDFVEKQYESQLNWKLESDQRKSPVWKSSVRKILFSNMRFRKHPDDKGLFCLAA